MLNNFNFSITSITQWKYNFSRRSSETSRIIITCMRFKNDFIDPLRALPRYTTKHLESRSSDNLWRENPGAIKLNDYFN